MVELGVEPKVKDGFAAGVDAGWENKEAPGCDVACALGVAAELVAKVLDVDDLEAGCCSGVSSLFHGNWPDSLDVAGFGVPNRLSGALGLVANKLPVVGVKADDDVPNRFDVDFAGVFEADASLLAAG